MSLIAERTQVKAPTNYPQWLECLEAMKSGPVSGNDAFEAAATGSFAGTEVTLAALQKQLVETVNTLLDKSAKRFLRRINEAICFNDLSQMDVLFRHLKRDVHQTLFFEGLSFLPEPFRAELAQSVREQMQKFWDDTVKFLRDQTLENPNSQLEDVLFLIKRIHLFEV